MHASGQTLDFADELQNYSEQSIGDNMVTELVYDALLLMLIGMGSVFSFLFILVLSVLLMSRWLPKPKPVPASTSSNSATGDSAVPASVVAAIGAAIHQFRQK